MRHGRMIRTLMATIGASLFSLTPLSAQINYGTTGLMNLPTADMQRDKTFMAGGWKLADPPCYGAPLVV